METTPQHYENELSSENLEKYLEDCMFIQFFNSFLSLQVFQYRLLYNAVTNQFEEFSNNVADEKDVELLSPSPSKWNASQNEVWTRKGYYITTIDREEGIEWIKEYRLPFFLRSEVYADFKLAKILTSYQTNLFHKFLRPDLNFLSKLVNKSSITNNNIANNNNSLSKCNLKNTSLNYLEHNNNNEGNDLYNGDKEVNDLYNGDKEEITTNSSNENETNISHISNDNNVHEELNMFKFLNSYVSSMPLLRERVLCNDEEGDDGDKEIFQLDNVNNLLKQLYRNVKLQEDAETIRNENDSFVNDYHQKLNDILLVTDAIKRDTKCNGNGNGNDSPNMQFEKLLKIAELWPINLSYKKGMDAFKEFLDDTPGGRNLLLWIEVEMSRHCNQHEKKSILQEIKEKFFRADSPHYVSKHTWKSWGMERSSKVTLEELLSSREYLLNPLVNYWCPRFTLHLYREKLQHENSGKQTYFNDDRLYHNLPQRPLSCRSHRKEVSLVNRSKSFCAPVSTSPSITSQQSYTITSSEFFSLPSSRGKHTNGINDEVIRGRSSLEMFDGTNRRSNGITKQTRRAKTAHPRVLTTPDLRNTNTSYEQLLLSSVPVKEYGFKRLPSKYFHNDASDATHRKNVRLYVEPIPTRDATASTISLRRNFYDEEVNCDRCQLDTLVDVLLHEKHSGNYFLKFLRDEDNKLWMDCYLFWKSLQGYNEYFLSQTFSPHAVKRKSNLIYSSFIVSSSEHDVHCSPSLQTNIFQRLDPPYEDLFDGVEEHVLLSLFTPYRVFQSREKTQFNELKREKQLKYLDVPPSVKKKFLPAEGEKLQVEDTPDELEKDKEKICPEVVDQTPQHADGFNFDALLRNKLEMEYFRSFLELKYKQGMSDLKAWTDFEVFRRLPPGKPDEIHNARNRKAMENREKWLGKNYFFGANSPATKAGQKKVLELAGKVQFLPDRPSTPVCLEAQKYMRARLEQKWLVLFKESESYQARMKSEENTNKMVEDLLMQKQLRKSVTSYKKMSHVAFSSTKLASLRMTITDPRERELFRKFIKVYGDLMENNLDFWLEVQKYKDLCHNHVEETLIKQKIQTIIDVYIRSSVHPEVQIDIHTDIAERLYEKACGRYPQHSPYIFREAQTTVLRVMFDNWNEYVTYRQKFSDELKLSESLKTLEKRYSDENKKRKMIIERKRLCKLLTDKNRNDMQKGVSKVQQDLLNIVQKNMTTKEGYEGGEVKTFIYSKYLAEDDLNNLEERMRQHGIYETETNPSQKYPTTSRRTSSALKDKSSSELSDKLWKFNNGTSRKSLVLPKEVSAVDAGSASSWTSVKRNFQLPRNSCAKKHDNISFENDLNTLRNSSLEPLKELERENEEDSVKLTKKYLREFDKSPQGKQLTIPLPIVRIQATNEENHLLPMVMKESNKLTTKKGRPRVLVQRPLPRNAGTASLIAKQGRRLPLAESPPPKIDAVVIVC